MIDDGKEACDLSDEMKRRKAELLRLGDFSGVTSIPLKCYFHIIRKGPSAGFSENRPTGKPGMFGLPNGYV
jgi:hypothetical protein